MKNILIVLLGILLFPVAPIVIMVLAAHTWGEMALELIRKHTN